MMSLLSSLTTVKAYPTDIVPHQSENNHTDEVRYFVDIKWFSYGRLRTIEHNNGACIFCEDDAEDESVI